MLFGFWVCLQVWWRLQKGGKTKNNKGFIVVLRWGNFVEVHDVWLRDFAEVHDGGCLWRQNEEHKHKVKRIQMVIKNLMRRKGVKVYLAWAFKNITSYCPNFFDMDYVIRKQAHSSSLSPAIEWYYRLGFVSLTIDGLSFHSSTFFNFFFLQK